MRESTKTCILQFFKFHRNEHVRCRWICEVIYSPHCPFSELTPWHRKPQCPELALCVGAVSPWPTLKIFFILLELVLDIRTGLPHRPGRPAPAWCRACWGCRAAARAPARCWSPPTASERSSRCSLNTTSSLLNQRVEGPSRLPISEHC